MSPQIAVVPAAFASNNAIQRLSSLLPLRTTCRHPLWNSQTWGEHKFQKTVDENASDQAQREWKPVDAIGRWLEWVERWAGSQGIRSIQNLKRLPDHCQRRARRNPRGERAHALDPQLLQQSHCTTNILRICVYIYIYIWPIYSSICLFFSASCHITSYFIISYQFILHYFISYHMILF